MDKLIDRQAALQDKIDALGAWELDRTLEIAMDALRCPQATRQLTPSPVESGGAWRYADSSCRNPSCSSWMSRPTTSTPSQWHGLSGTCRSTREPLSALPTTVTSSTT